jgi:hypothetical protein
MWHGRLNINLHGAVAAYLKYYRYLDGRNMKSPHSNLRPIRSEQYALRIPIRQVTIMLVSPIAEIFKNILSNINEPP